MTKQVEIRDSVDDIVQGLLARARRLFPPPATITAELASMDMILVCRLKHEDVKLVMPWVVIVDITTCWDSRPKGRSVMALDDMTRIVERYDRIIDQASSLGLFKSPEDSDV